MNDKEEAEINRQRELAAVHAANEIAQKLTRVEERLATAIRWLKRIEIEYPGSINEGAIKKHLED